MKIESGIHNVRKTKLEDGFRYTYAIDNEISITRGSVDELEEAVKDQGLEWKMLDYELAYADVSDDDWVFPLAHPPKPSDYL